MRFPAWLKVYGDQSYRGECRREEAEQIDAFAYLEHHHPEIFKLAIHPKIEGKRTWGQAARDRKNGSLGRGAPDVMVPICPPFLCELKRADHTKSAWQKGQKEYLETAQKQGAFVCVALGFEGFKEALNEYLHQTNQRK